MPEAKVSTEKIKENYSLVLIAALAVLFIGTGILIGWAGFHELAVLQPIFIAGLFVAVLKFRGLGKNEAIFLLLVFLLGYGIRAQNIQPQYEYFFGFDSYYHARMVEHIIVDGKLPEIDSLSYFELPDAQRGIPQGAMLFWYITAGLFKAFTMFAPHSRELWVEVMKTLPAFFGAFISLLMYFLGKELWGKKAGYMSAFIAAVIPSYVYRTMAGFLEDDALGFFWFVAGTIFFLRALKKPALDREHLIDAVLAGVLFSGMALSWGFFLIVPILLIFAFPFCTLLFLSRKEIEHPELIGVLFISFFLGAVVVMKGVVDALFGSELGAILNIVFTALLLVCLAVLGFISWNKDREFFGFLANYLIVAGVFLAITIPFIGLGWFGTMNSYVGSAVPFSTDTGTASIGTIIAFAFMALIVGFFLYLLLFGTKDSKKRTTTIRILVIVALVAVLLFTGFILMDLNGMFSSRLQTTEVFLSTVGEEGAGNIHFGYKYGILILFALAIVVMPFFIAFNKKDYLTPIAFWWIAISVVMAWYKLKFTYHLGLPLALGAGFFAGALFYYFHDFKGAEAKVGALALAFMLLCGVAIGGYFVTQRQPTLDTDPLWEDTLIWMKDNTPDGAKYMNWWSYGHWITFVSGKSVFADNRNVQWDVSDGHYSKFMMAQELEESLELIRMHKPEYVLVDSRMFSQFQSFAIYNFKVTASDLDKNTYIRNLLMFAQPVQLSNGTSANFYAPCIEIMDQNAYRCSGGNVPVESLLELSDEWSKVPALQADGIPVWYYREKDQDGFAMGYGIFLSTINNSTLARLWFQDPETMKYFEQIYSVTDGGKTIKIFKVNKEAFGWTE